MKKYYLVTFLILQSIFLQGQNEKEKLPPKKWEFGIQSNIAIANRIYVEKYLKENLSIKTSLVSETWMIPNDLIGFFAWEGEFRYYPKMISKWQTWKKIDSFYKKRVLEGELRTYPEMIKRWRTWQTYYSLGISLRTNYLGQYSGGYGDRVPRGAIKIRSDFYYKPPSIYNTYPCFQIGVGKKLQLTENLHFEMGGDLYFLFDVPFVARNGFPFPVPTFTLRVGIHKNKN